MACLNCGINPVVEFNYCKQCLLDIFDNRFSVFLIFTPQEEAHFGLDERFCLCGKKVGINRGWECFEYPHFGVRDEVDCKKCEDIYLVISRYYLRRKNTRNAPSNWPGAYRYRMPGSAYSNFK